jgi:splicing factor 1
MNTRDLRMKDKYIKERTKLITEVIELDPTYVPPPDYKPPKRFRKIPIPDNDSSMNYIGQIIGPSGQTQ